jgi:hypothetical protein
VHDPLLDGYLHCCRKILTGPDFVSSVLFTDAMGNYGVWTDFGHWHGSSVAQCRTEFKLTKVQQAKINWTSITVSTIFL